MCTSWILCRLARTLAVKSAELFIELFFMLNFFGAFKWATDVDAYKYTVDIHHFKLPFASIYCIIRYFCVGDMYKKLVHSETGCYRDVIRSDRELWEFWGLSQEIQLFVFCHWTAYFVGYWRGDSDFFLCYCILSQCHILVFISLCQTPWRYHRLNGNQEMNWISKISYQEFL